MPKQWSNKRFSYDVFGTQHVLETAAAIGDRHRLAEQRTSRFTKPQVTVPAGRLDAP